MRSWLIFINLNKLFHIVDAIGIFIQKFTGAIAFPGFIHHSVVVIIFPVCINAGAFQKSIACIADGAPVSRCSHRTGRTIGKSNIQIQVVFADILHIAAHAPDTPINILGKIGF
ncbi:MAG: hypothetical protein XE04_1611 [Marinimicrobia bacterium 46_43]|nr:MAG: hypothetical protein XE04_1611 [Marinimicrobia bacterium 46_43]